MRRIDPERTSVEFQLNEAVSKLRQTLQDMAKRSMNESQEFLEKYSQAKETEKAQLVKQYQEKKLEEMKNFQKDISDRTKTIENLEKQNQSQYSEIRQNISEIKEKIVGTGIGRVSELMTIRDLKEVVPSDSFSELRASKGGTDIVGTVKENGLVYGTITISNKCTQKWSGDFTTQIVRNMRDDGSQFAILVSKVFPGEALSSKAWVMDVEDGKSVILVKPEYAPLAYFGLRQGAIHWFETRRMLKRKEEEENEAEKISRALIAWINGEEFQAITRCLKDAREDAEKTKQEMQHIEEYIHAKVTSTLVHQQKIIDRMLQAKNTLETLRRLLEGELLRYFFDVVW